MVDEIRNDSNINKQTPYRISDVKSENFNNVSLFQADNFKTTFDINRPVQKKTDAEKLHHKWEKVVNGMSQEFFDEITAMSKRLKCDPEDLTALMYGESNFNPNPKGDTYKGIIQMDKYSLKKSVEYAIKNKNLNIKVDENMKMKDFVKLSREEQLPYAEAYLNLMKDECGLKGKKLSGGKLWGLIKSPKQTKENNQQFFKKLEHKLDSIKDIPLKYEIPYYLQRNPND